MISRFSYKIADFLYCKGSIEAEEREVYQYGYEILLDILFDTGLLLLLGVVFGTIPQTICFIIIFAGIRQFSGGYHADTRRKCVIVTCAAWFLATQASKFSLTQHSMYMVVVMLISWITFWLLAPVEHPNNPLQPDNRQRNRRISFGMLALASVIVFVDFIYGKHLYSVTIINTLLIVSIFMIVAIWKGGTHKDGKDDKAC